jgi:hypothetical protein
MMLLFLLYIFIIKALDQVDNPSANCNNTAGDGAGEKIL